MNKWSTLITPETLVGALDLPNLLILDCRFSLQVPSAGLEAYKTSHIPGAKYLSLDDELSQPPGTHGGRHPLPSKESMAHLCDSLGITKNSRVVIYDDQRFAFAARCWWMLKNSGLPSVSVLDGGFSNYENRGFPCIGGLEDTNTDEGSPTLSSWEWKIESSVVNIETIKTQHDGMVLVDSRHPDRYAGLKEPIDLVAGHIPGAVNFFWQEVTDEKGWMRSPPELRDHFAAIADQQNLVVYCGSGVTACVNLLAMEIAGIKGAKLYPGSWSDWCSYPINEAWEIIED